MTEFTPPRVLSVEPTSPHYHPSFTRVGVRIDGNEVNDCWYYNLDRREYRLGRSGAIRKSDSIEPYLRITTENRQERRRREQWERKHPSLHRGRHP